MRTLILALVAVAALGSATAAFAQMQTSNEGPSGTIVAPVGGSNAPFSNPNYFADTVQDRYALAITMLKKKMDRLTRDDGGKLTPEHATALQQDLDTLNRRFGLKVASR